MEIKQTDIVVAGGGLAGISAAIAAARAGKKVSLIQNRGVLGGNSSSEIRVWVCGATKHGVNRFARETGIMGELFLENQYRNPQGNVYLWDLLLLEKVKKERNITLYLNTEVVDVAMENERIGSIVTRTQGAELVLRHSADYFIDCTGDGFVGALAGADFHIGRESQAAFAESLAPKEADSQLLGSSLLFYTKDTGRKTKFIAPPFAKKIADTSIIKNRTIQAADNGCAYWWIEWGGELDTIGDNEAIRDELLAVVYGIWDHIKNSGAYEADQLDLEWVGTLPGKRESRRFMGDYVLKQQDIEAQTNFKDRIGFGGWSIDLHPATGMYTESAGAKHVVADGIYHLPYRMLYSKNIPNLFFAGRNVSASHIAFGTIRVMATCALLGEAAGTAAAFAIANGCTPREIYQRYLAEYQQLLLKNDASIIGIRNQDPADLARLAEVTASSSLTQLNTYHNKLEKAVLTKDYALLLPQDSGMTTIDLLLESEAEHTVVVECYDTGRPENYIPAVKLSETAVRTNRGRHWYAVTLPDTAVARNLFVIIRKQAETAAFLSQTIVPGVLTFINDPIAELAHPELHDYARKSPILYWTNQKINRRNLVFRSDVTSLYQPATITNGYARPYGTANMWVSAVSADAETITLTWEAPQKISEIRLTFNDDVNEDLVNLHHHTTDFECVPELIKDFELWYQEGSEEKCLLRVSDNRQRHLVIPVELIQTQSLQLRLLETNGAEFKSVVEIRVYE